MPLESTTVLPEAAPHRGPYLHALLKARYGTIALAAALVGCGSGSDAPSGPVTPPPPPPPPAVGDLSVTVATTGEDPDPDGYTVILDGSQTRTMAASATTTFVGVSTGTHTLLLDGIANNCGPEGTNPRTLTVTANTTTSVGFSVQCNAFALRFEIGPNVPESDVQAIKDGIATARAYLNAELGGDIPREEWPLITVEVIVDGTGAVCCSAGTDRLRFDVKHPEWDRTQSTGAPWSLTIDKQKTAGHEYGHTWSLRLGLGGVDSWLTEGVAEFVTYNAMIAQGKMMRGDVDAFQLLAARNTGELSQPLETLQGSGIWPGHVGYIALTQLVSQSANGPLSIRILCEETAAKGLTAAFQSAFGIPLADFYAEFEQWRQSPPPAPPPDVTPPIITPRGITGLDGSNAQQVSLVLDGKVVDRNGDGTAVTSATVQVTLEGPLPGAFDGVCGTGDEFDKFQDVLVTPPNNPAATDLVIVDVTSQVNANGGDFSVAFTAQNQAGNLGLGDYTYCFEIVADDGAKRKDGTDDGLAVSAFGGKDFTWQ